MNNFIKIDFPDVSNDFIEGIILLDEAVCRFGLSDHQHAETLHRVISALVREFDDTHFINEEEE